MSAVAIISILLGVSIIIARAPLIFAPRQTLDFYMKILATPSRVRLLGLILALLSVAIIIYLEGVEGTLALVIMVMAIITLVFSIGFISLFPEPFRRLATMVWAERSDGFLRVVGVLAVAVGVAFVWFGLGA